MTRLEYLILMFPPNQIMETIRLTNRELTEREEKSITIGEIVKFKGSSHYNIQDFSFCRVKICGVKLRLPNMFQNLSYAS